MTRYFIVTNSISIVFFSKFVLIGQKDFIDKKGKTIKQNTKIGTQMTLTPSIEYRYRNINVFQIFKNKKEIN